MDSKVQVLVATMNQNDHSLLTKLNIQSDAIVGNQCGYDSIERFTWSDNNYNITYLNFNERGVGLNRNNALMRATGEICIFADDDMVYCNNYPQIVERSFEEYKKADVIVFNITEPIGKRYVIKRPQKVKWFNCLRYGAARIAVRTKSIKENGILFNLCFGGGAEYSAGEDCLFLMDCIKRGLNVVAVPLSIATLTEERDSTWFKGYTKKYFMDKGKLFEVISKRYKKLLCLQDAIRHNEEYGMTWRKAYKLMTSETEK